MKIARFDRQACESFLRMLWPAEPLPASLVVFTKPGALCTWCRDIGQALTIAAKNYRHRDVYFGVALQDQAAALAKAREKKPAVLVNKVRGSSCSAAAIPGLWVDLDVKGPSHSEPNLPPDLDSALSLLEVVPQKPTLIVNSGHGVHVYWLFHEPWILASDEDRRRAGEMLQRLQDAIRTEAAIHGWKLDPTADLARLLRLPGTLNHKGAR